MLMVIPNEGKQFWLDRALFNESQDPGNIIVRLYVEDYTPDDNSVFDSFSPAGFTGSDPIELVGEGWSGAVIVADIAESTYTPAPFWTNTGVTTETAYGWYAYNSDMTICVAAQRFDTPRVMSPGATETLDPFKLQLKTFA